MLSQRVRGRVHMGPFSPGVSVIPALRRGNLVAFGASVYTTRRDCRDKRGNDGILTQQVADLNML